MSSNNQSQKIDEFDRSNLEKQIKEQLLKPIQYAYAKKKIDDKKIVDDTKKNSKIMSLLKSEAEIPVAEAVKAEIPVVEAVEAEIPVAEAVEAEADENAKAEAVEAAVTWRKDSRGHIFSFDTMPGGTYDVVPSP